MRLRVVFTAGCALLTGCVAEAGAGYGAYSYGPAGYDGGYAPRPYYREPPPLFYDGDRRGYDYRRAEQDRNRDRAMQDRANRDRSNQDRVRQQQQQQQQQMQRQQQQQARPAPGPRGPGGPPNTEYIPPSNGNGPP